jgi:hypothetical protein
MSIYHRSLTPLLSPFSRKKKIASMLVNDVALSAIGECLRNAVTGQGCKVLCGNDRQR